MKINILSVTVETIPTAKGSYEKASVAYKDDKGKVTGKNIVSFVNKPVWELISKAQPGEMYEVKNEKIGDNWNWTEAVKTTAEESPKLPQGQGTYTSPKSTYETPEERAKKQIYIVRQSSISNAIAYATGVQGVKTVEALLTIAKKFEQYVFEEDKVEDDIPKVEEDD